MPKEPTDVAHSVVVDHQVEVDLPRHWLLQLQQAVVVDEGLHKTDAVTRLQLDELLVVQEILDFDGLFVGRGRVEMEGDLGVSEDALEVTSDLDYLPANDVDHRGQHEVPRDEDAGARFEGALGVREFDLDEAEAVEGEVESLLRARKFELVNWGLVGLML